MQYLPAKPIKRGYTIWCLCESIIGSLFNFRVYLRKEEVTQNETHLGDHNFEGKQLYFDNYFTSLSLLEKLKVRRITATGTI